MMSCRNFLSGLFVSSSCASLPWSPPGSCCLPGCREIARMSTDTGRYLLHTGLQGSCCLPGCREIARMSTDTGRYLLRTGPCGSCCLPGCRRITRMSTDTGRYLSHTGLRSSRFCQRTEASTWGQVALLGETVSNSKIRNLRN